MCGRIRLSVLFFSAIAVAANASDAILELDGILRVKHAELKSATLTILHADGTVDIINKGLEHFKTQLPLRTYALFAFECSGCVTKQLYFDTYVPDNGLVNAPFEFPFEVTLEAPPPGQHFEYAGPVGYIRYREELQDFGYDTDYAKRADPEMEERMHVILASTRTSDEVMTAVNATLRIGERSGTPTMVRDAVVVPALETRPTLVHPTGMRPRRPEEARSSTEMEAAHPASPRTMGPAPVERTVMRPPLAHKEEPQQPAIPALVTEDAAGSSRREDLIVERLRVTRIVRLEKEGKLTEFRRVESMYGPVYYFKNGESCSELLYEQGIRNELTAP